MCYMNAQKERESDSENFGEQSAEEALGGVDVADLEASNSGRVSVVMVGGCSSPFYSGRGGAHRGGGGGKGRR
jgi:hypothetical protein